ncbi:conserved hypothetical protein [Histoplasma capsulatum H143]|uniref:Uncharacterized protein n=1 Tax=Ajellomyces capsulatus (strain H143) TaxID=544712 RepID=C6HG25_AJECH|nr:conserved hypothetical protein [Histoplasma capsulatum H143]
MESSNPAPLSGTPGDEDIYTRNNNDNVSNRDASSIYKGGIPTSAPPVNKSHKSSPRPRNISNPLQTGILNYLKSQQHDQYNHCLPTYFHPVSPQSPSIPLPKRFTVYTPLLLLPSNTFSLPPEWATLYNTFSSAQRQELYACIVASFAPMGVTHIAINAPISPTTATGIDNRIRSPTGLAPLYGDFGEASDHVGGEAGRGESALWVRAVQNRGIVQIWAPFHSMFSRGNVVEKRGFWGLNVIRALEEAMQRTKTWKRIRHVNLGLLPSSKPSWEGAVKVLDTEAGGWIHVHENVDIKSIGMMEEEEVHSLHRHHNPLFLQRSVSMWKELRPMPRA